MFSTEGQSVWLEFEEMIAINGYILFNTMILEKEQEQRNDRYLTLYNSCFTHHRLSKVENHNEVLIIKRIA